MQRKTIGLDIAKRVFQAHAVDPASGAVTRTKLQRAEVLPYVAQLQPSLIVMEACGAAQHWAREFAKLGHEVKLGEADRAAVRAAVREDGMDASPHSSEIRQ